MSTQENPISAFFCSFTFHRYAYDPANPPDAEFKRLCEARLWGGVKIAENFAKYTLALEAARADSAIARFFRKYEFVGFTHVLAADPQAEFDRLQAARRWGVKKLNKIRKEFLAASKADIVGRLPIVEFLKENSCVGYHYGSGPPELEFKALMAAHKGNWTQEEILKGNDVTSESARRRWRLSAAYRELEELRASFYGAIEEQFDLMLDLIAGKTGLRRDEVMVELYCVGKAPLPREETEIVSLHFP
jgi:hypothetical protein